MAKEVLLIKLGLFTERIILYRIQNMPPENVSQIGGTPQTHGMREIVGTLRRERTNTLKTPVPNGAGGHRLKRLLVSIMLPK